MTSSPFPRLVRRAVLALALVAYLVPALGGMLGGVCFRGDGGIGLGCCRPSSASDCCGDPSAAAPPANSCCGNLAPGETREDAPCVHVDPQDEPSPRADDPPAPLPDPLSLAATAVLASPLAALAPSFDGARPGARAGPPPEVRGRRPFVLRV